MLATYDAWKTNLWSEINTEALEDANKKISTELRRIGEQNQIVKAWGLYKVRASGHVSPTLLRPVCISFLRRTSR